MKFLVSFLLLLLSIYSFAQQQLSGHVLTEDNTPLPFANVILNSTDGSLLGGTITTDDGKFLINFPKETSEIKVFVSFIGFESDTIFVTKNENKELNFTLREIADTISEVVVSARRDIFKLKNGSIVASVQNSALERSPNMENMLNNVPFVSGKNGMFQVFGRGVAQFYINGHKVLDMSEVNRLQPSQIQTIEVVTDPSGKYSSEVNAIIKIHTKGYQDGLGGNFYSDVQLRDYSYVSYNENLAFTLNVNRWQFGISAFYSRFNIPNKNSSIETLYSDQIYTFTEYSQGERTSPVVSGNFDFNYTFSNGGVIGASAFMYKYKQAETYTNLQSHTAGDVEDYSSRTRTENTRTPKHLIANVFCNMRIGKTKINFSDDIMKGTLNLSTTENFIDENAMVNTRLSTNYTMNSFVADFKTEPNDVLSINYGAEYTYSDNTQEFSFDIQNFETDMETSAYEIRQNLSAEYINVQADFSKINMTAGLRYEFSDMQYVVGNVKNDEQSRTNKDFFPYFNVQYSDDLLDVSLTYRKSVKRPAYNNLSNALIYAGPFDYTSGNAWLKPTYTQKISFLASLGDFSLTGSYDFINNASNYVLDVYKDSDNIVWSHLSNFEQYEECSLGVEWERTFGIYTPCIEVDCGKQNFKYVYIGAPRKYNSPFFSIDIAQSFKLPHKITLDIDAGYSSKQYSMFEKEKWDWNLDVVASKIFDCGVRLSCSATNLFNNNFVESETFCNNVNVCSKEEFNVPTISISATYSFNTLKNRNSQGKKTTEFSRFD